MNGQITDHMLFLSIFKLVGDIRWDTLNSGDYINMLLVTKIV